VRRSCFDPFAVLFEQARALVRWAHGAVLVAIEWSRGLTR
jgi:hypothetical protein